MSSRTDAPSAGPSTAEPMPARAARYHSVGGPEVIDVETITVAAPGEGEVRIRLAAAGLNPVDYKIRRGTSRFPVTVPTTLGREFSGVVESVGAGVTDVAAGDHVFGSIPSGAACDLVVAPVDALAPVPDDVPLEVAGGLALAGQTAWDALESQHLAEGDTVVVSAAAGGVGGILCQLAIARGLRVIGTASESNHAWLAERGVVPVLYGDGLTARLRDAGADGITAVFDQHGPETIRAALELGVPPERINTIATDPEPFGVRRVGRGAVHAPTLRALVALVGSGAVDVPIAARYPLAEVREAFVRLESGHLRGKIVLVP
ncbi:MAG: NADP-dependent oxidoreductase [Actinobacteria bacterium]|nr:NADP-dependent oxidoreductase [Actinomycetota bacterium]MBU1608533.1 NADP-dependent oxidoreductase [Actinomycetota bacterium]MBU2315311.1 NADP-dependent oxidoreductase [Actinomycetota bacterium]MBU2384741.1 NADP-dependent oxidoreductase [Actinomycetota bacterium]